MPPSTRKRVPETANDSQSPAKKPRTVKGKAAAPGNVVEADDDNKPINSPSQLTPGVKLPTKRSQGTSLNKSLKPGNTEKPLEIAEKKVSTTRSIKKEETPEPDPESLASPRSKSNRRVRTETVAVEETKTAIGVKSDTSPKKIPKKGKTKSHHDDEEEEEEAGDPDSEGATPKKTKRKRKSKEEKEAEAMPLAARATGLRMFLGAHVSGAKGVQNAVTNCVHIGGNAFALFLKSQRKWDNPPLQDEHRDGFKANCVRHGYDATRHVLPHGSYLVNLAQENAEKAAQAYGSFVEDLRRCEALGITLYNFHPGTTNNQPRPAAIARIASALNRALSATTTVTPLLETMAGSGTVIGSTFADLAAIIALVDDKSRVGVCLDTCHLFAAGYDLRAPPAFAAVLRDFDATVGLRYVKALHLNDSKAPLGSRRDLHANIGTGFLGLRAFWNVMNERAFEGLPMVLETPIDRKVDDGAAKEDSAVDDGEQNAQGKGGVKVKAKRKGQTDPKVDGSATKDDLDAEDGEQNADANDTAKAKGKKKGPVKPPKEKTVEDKSIWAREIKLLESLIGMDAESEEFKVLEKGLADQGAEERKKYQEAYDRKLAKEEKVKTKDIGSFFAKKKENGKADAVVVGDGSPLSELSELSDGFEK